MADNIVNVSGNLTAEPDLRYTTSGKAMARMRVAVNRSWFNKKTGEKQEESHYLTVVCWARLAENVADSLGKGDRVMISGRLQQRRWQTEAGDRRSVVEITADDIGASLRHGTADVRKTRREDFPPDSGAF